MNLTAEGASLSTSLLITVVLVFICMLFLVAYWADRTQNQAMERLISSPVIYTLSIAVYCTSWTFYGAVGAASRNGIEYLTIYLGPTLVFVGWWFGLRKILAITKAHRITSIADFISSRFGKSGRLSAIVSLIAITAITPYIALQLKAVATSFDVVAGTLSEAGARPIFADSGLWIAGILAIFAILFGTGKVGADEQHRGVVTAIAIESILKLVALLGVGGFVVFGIAGGIGPLLNSAETAPLIERLAEVNAHSPSRWLTMLILAASAILCLPRQFQVTFVEAQSSAQTRTASWLFPVYLFLISLSVIPIAIVGEAYLPAGSNPDLYVLTLPLSENQTALTVLAFLGGFSSATSMVIVSSVALSIMASNHLILPLLFRNSPVTRSRDNTLSSQILFVRRASILTIIALGYVYYRTSVGTGGLASIGLISFSGVAQFLPALLIGVFWRNASAAGAIAGLTIGTTIWAYTLLLPSLGLLQQVSIPLLDQQALFGIAGLDPLVHTTFWSLSLNTFAVVLVSMLTHRRPLERIQAALFVDVFRYPTGILPRQAPSGAAASDLYIIAQRILGHERAYKLFNRGDENQQRPETEASPEFVSALEREIAANVGAASARTLINHVARGEIVGIEDVIEILDETQQVHRYSLELEAKSQQLSQTAAELQRANELLKRLDQQKDDFLSSVSHELRTPMTSIRSFSEILGSTEVITNEERSTFLTIIARESERLTRLLDQILDLSRLENGATDYPVTLIDPQRIIAETVQSLEALSRASDTAVHFKPKRTSPQVLAHADALQQVFVNLISNAIKFNQSAAPTVNIRCRTSKGWFIADVSDNGPGIAPEHQQHIFSKFGRSWRNTEPAQPGSGLGLTISKEILAQFGGHLTLSSKLGQGSCFSVHLPLDQLGRGIN